MIIILSAVLICALLLLIKIITKEIIDKKLFVYFIVLIIYLAYLTGHLFIFERNSYYSFTSVMFLYFICPCLPIPYIYLAYEDIKIDYKKIFKPYTIVLLIIALLAIYEFITRKYLISDIDVDTVYKSMKVLDKNAIRAIVFSSSYLTIGDYLGIGVFCCLFKIIDKNKYGYIVPIIVLLLAVLATLSRGPLVAIFFGAVVLFVVKAIQEKNYKKLINTALFVFSLGIISLIILYFVSDKYFYLFVERICSIFDWSTDSSGNAGRVRRWRFYIDLILSNNKTTLFGIGISRAAYGNAYNLMPESGLILNVAEQGVVGSLLYYFLIFYPIFTYLKVKNKTNFGMILLACITCYLVHDLVLQFIISVDGRISFYVLYSLLFYELIKSNRN